jgi:SAM-dependent methyltransferase
VTRRSWRRRFVRRVYADHNDSPAVRETLAGLLEGLGAAYGLNVGAGTERLDPRLFQVDLFVGSSIDCVARAERLPFAAGVFDLVVSQETIEHVPDPFGAVREMARVMKPGARLYLQVPFVIGYHPGPEDYWRFTRAGLETILRQAGIEPLSTGISVGGGTGFYRIAVEFIAGVAGRLWPVLYHPTKGAASLLCYPLKWFDGWLSHGAQRDRIAGGFLVVGALPDDAG